jgi:hypothetical protein
MNDLFMPLPDQQHPIRKMFRTRPAPRPVVADLVHFPAGAENEEFWTIRLYRDDFDNNSAEDRLVIFNWVSDTIKAMRIIEPNVYVEVYERVPR